MANDEEVLAATVREYFVKNGGKVKRNDLFDYFRDQLDKFDDEGTSKNRFGDIVDSLASLQNLEGEKYFVLKKSRNATTPVLLRRQMRQVNQRKDKGVSLPASMRNFRFSAAEDASGNVIIGDKIRSGTSSRMRAGTVGFRSESHDSRMRRNGSDNSVGEQGHANDSGIDTASESPRGSRQSSEYDRFSQNSGDTGIFYDQEEYYEDLPSHVLTPFEKSWMMSAMAGNKSEIVCQMAEDNSIVNFKDFIVGYTALHWSAKLGNADILRLLIDSGANVNVKSNGGYTPLHVATMAGKDSVIKILIDEYHADIHIRDHSGKTPKDHLKKSTSEPIKQKLREEKPAILIEDMTKKSRTLIPSGKKKGKRFGNILSRKHHNVLHHLNVDGEVPSKLRRSCSEGSTDDCDDVVDVIEPEEDSDEEMFLLQTVESCEETADDRQTLSDYSGRNKEQFGKDSISV